MQELDILESDFIDKKAQKLFMGGKKIAQGCIPHWNPYYNTGICFGDMYCSYRPEFHLGGGFCNPFDDDGGIYK